VTTREQALAILAEGQAALSDLADGLDDDAFARPAAIAGGDWSAKDLIAHVTTWEEIALRTIAEWRRGEEPWIESTPKDTNQINAETVARKAPMTSEEVRVEARRVHEELRERIRGITDEEWDAEAFWKTERRRTFGGLVGAVLAAPRRPFGHAFAHLADLQAYASSAAKSD
jgi:hypothetical protein